MKSTTKKQNEAFKVFTDFQKFTLSMQQGNNKEKLIYSTKAYVDHSFYNSSTCSLSFQLLRIDLMNQSIKKTIPKYEAVINGQKVSSGLTMARKYKMFENIAKFSCLTCEYCLKKIEVNEVSFDHYIPQSKGGADDKGRNLSISCLPCNKLKGAIHPFSQKKLFHIFINQVRNLKDYSQVNLLKESYKDEDDFLFFISDKRDFFTFEDWCLISDHLKKRYHPNKLKNLVRQHRTLKYVIRVGMNVAKKEIGIRKMMKEFSNATTIYYRSNLDIQIVMDKIKNKDFRSDDVLTRIYTDPIKINEDLVHNISHFENMLKQPSCCGSDRVRINNRLIQLMSIKDSTVESITLKQ